MRKDRPPISSKRTCVEYVVTDIAGVGVGGVVVIVVDSIWLITPTSFFPFGRFPKPHENSLKQKYKLSRLRMAYLERFCGKKFAGINPRNRCLKF